MLWEILFEHFLAGSIRHSMKGNLELSNKLLSNSHAFWFRIYCFFCSFHISLLFQIPRNRFCLAILLIKSAKWKRLHNNWFAPMGAQNIENLTVNHRRYCRLWARSVLFVRYCWIFSLLFQEYCNNNGSRFIHRSREITAWLISMFRFRASNYYKYIVKHWKILWIIPNLSNKS